MADVTARIDALVDDYRNGRLDRAGFVDAVCALDWQSGPAVAIAAIDAVDQARKKRRIEIDIQKEIVDRVSRMRTLARAYRAGDLDRAAFVEAMLAFEWNPTRNETIPPEVREAGSVSRWIWRDAQIGKAMIPDSLDELVRMRHLDLIDDDVYREIFHHHHWGTRP